MRSFRRAIAACVFVGVTNVWGGCSDLPAPPIPPSDAGPTLCGDIARNVTCQVGESPVVVGNKDVECSGGEAKCIERDGCNFRCAQQCGVEGSHKCDGQLSLTCKGGAFVDPIDCSAKGSRCDQNGGTCEGCGTNQKRCNNVCTDLDTDSNCGDCGIVCDQTDVNLDNHCEPSSVSAYRCSERCKYGKVLVVQDSGKKTCETICGVSGQIACNGVCTNTLTDPQHCGGCSPAPPDTNDPNSVPACTNGTPDIGCKNGFNLRCGTPKKCVDTKTDPTNCGACGTTCTALNGTNTCNGNGQCSPTCDSTHATCDGNPNNGCEADATSNATCGQGCAVCQGTLACAPVGGSYTCATCEQRGLVTCSGQCVAPFRPGFGHRVAVPITNPGGSVADYQVKLSLNTQSLIAAGKLAADGKDLRLTTSDGLTLIPFWFDPRTLNTTSTTVWARLPSIAPGASSIFVYYTNAAATAASDFSSTFIGAITDPLFHGGAGSHWAQSGPFNASFVDGASMSANQCGPGDACVRMALSRAQNPNGDWMEYCQPANFPAGSDYKIAFEIEITAANRAFAEMRVNTDVAYSSPKSIVARAAVETSVIAAAAQTKTLCVRVFLEGNVTFGQDINAFYRSLKVRRFVSPEPVAGVGGVEQAPCP